MSHLILIKVKKSTAVAVPFYFVFIGISSMLVDAKNVATTHSSEHAAKTVSIAHSVRVISGVNETGIGKVLYRGIFDEFFRTDCGA